MTGQDVTLYRLYDRSGVLLYVGITQDWSTRAKQHGSKSWWADVARVSLEEFPGREEAATAELRAIASERPRHNRWPGRQWIAPHTHCYVGGYESWSFPCPNPQCLHPERRVVTSVPGYDQEGTWPPGAATLEPR
jgi:hypothetical protein